MKLKISDMMDHAEGIPLKIQVREVASVDQIKETVMNKIQNHSEASRHFPTARKMSRAGIIASVLVAALCIGVCAAAAIGWSGFTLTDGMSDAETEALLQEASVGYAGSYEDADGTVHYLDKEGKETMVLSREDAAEYERELQAAKDQAVINSTSLVDLSTVSLLPQRVIELATEKDGSFADHLLGNGSMILLYPAGEKGYSLRSGENITVEMQADAPCYMQFYLFENGEALCEKSLKAQEHSCTFSVENDGIYCIGVMYTSSSAGSFTDCSVMIEQ